MVGLGVIVGFAGFGESILAYLGVELPSLQAAGGLLLLLVALELLTGSYTEPTEEERTRVNVAFVPLGTPLLAGPGHRRHDGVRAAGRYGGAVHGVRGRAGGGHHPAVAYHAILRGIHRLLRPSGVELLTRIAAAARPSPSSSSSVRSGPWCPADEQKGRLMEARVKRIETGNADRNAGVIGDDEEVIVVDPGEYADPVFDAIGDREIIAVISTWPRGPHRGSVGVAGRDESPIALHPKDRLTWREAHSDELPEIEMRMADPSRSAIPGRGAAHPRAHPRFCQPLLRSSGCGVHRDALLVGRAVRARGHYPISPGSCRHRGGAAHAAGYDQGAAGHGKETTIAAAEKSFDDG